MTTSQSIYSPMATESLGHRARLGLPLRFRLTTLVQCLESAMAGGLTKVGLKT